MAAAAATAADADAAAAAAGNSELPNTESEWLQKHIHTNAPVVKDSNEMRGLVGDLLNIWCRNDDFTKIFVVSPFWSSGEVISDAKDWSERVKQMFARVPNKLKLYGRVNEPLPPNVKSLSVNFHAKFLAAINKKKNEVNVLLTSANFTSEHISFTEPKIKKYKNRDSVVHVTVSLQTFEDRFLKPLDDSGQILKVRTSSDSNGDEMDKLEKKFESTTLSDSVVNWKKQAFLHSSELGVFTSCEMKQKVDELLDQSVKEKGTLYVVSPFVDTVSVEYLQKKIPVDSSSGTQVKIITRQGQAVPDLSDNVKVDFKIKDSDKNSDNYFHIKFLCFVPDDRDKTAQLLLTSANFTNFHVIFNEDGKENRDWALKLEIKSEDFKAYFLEPINKLKPPTSNDS